MPRPFKIERVFVVFHFLTLKGFVLLFLLFSFFSNGQNNERLSRTSTDIAFRETSALLSSEAKQQLDTFAILFRSDTSLGIRLTVSYRDLCDKCGGLAWDRIQMIATYLTKAKVNHITSVSFLDGETNKVEVSIIPWTNSLDLPPHPTLRRKEKVN